MTNQAKEYVFLNNYLNICHPFCVTLNKTSELCVAWNVNGGGETQKQFVYGLCKTKHYLSLCAFYVYSFNIFICNILPFFSSLWVKRLVLHSVTYSMCKGLRSHCMSGSVEIYWIYPEDTPACPVTLHNLPIKNLCWACHSPNRSLRGRRVARGVCKTQHWPTEQRQWSQIYEQSGFSISPQDAKLGGRQFKGDILPKDTP